MKFNSTMEFAQITDVAWDAVIIGAGPAGSSAAISCAAPNRKILLLDAKKFPRRKACGGCLNQNSIRMLRGLMQDSESLFEDSIRLGKFDIYHRDTVFTHTVEEGYAVDRVALDAALVDVAQERGVVFADQVSAKLDHVQDDFRLVQLRRGTDNRTLKTRCVIIASGLGNRTASNFESLQQSPEKDSRVGIEAIFTEYPDDYRSGRLSMVIGDAGYVGLTEISDQRLHVAASVDRDRLQDVGPQQIVDMLLQEASAPALLQKDVQWKGTPALTARARHVAENRVFLVGDAAGYVEPFTGEGIRWALESGIGVAPFAISAMDEWDTRLIRDWENWHKRYIVRKQRLCRGLAYGLKRPALRWVAHQAMRLSPSFAQNIIHQINS